MPIKATSTIQHVWSILCSGVSVDQETNNLTLFNLVEQVKIAKNHLVKMSTVNGEEKPAAPIGFHLVSLWRRLKSETPLKADVEVEFLDPSGTMRQKGGYSINLPEKVERLRSRMEWRGIRVTTSGVYTFKISIKEEGQAKFRKIGEAQLNIQLLEDEKQSENN